MLDLLAVLIRPFADPGARTWWVALVVGVLVALVVGGVRRDGGLLRSARALAHRSSVLDVQLLVGRQLLLAVGALPVVGFGLWLATRIVFALDAWLGVPEVPVPTWLVTVAYTLVLFVAWDASRYVLHRLMHEVPALWALHQVHHSAEVLTPLTFHRIHPLESLLYGLRGALVTGVVAGGFFWLFRGQATEWTLLGVHGVGLVLNVVFGNLRHSHVWLGFGALERWFVSPAQHQLHHALDRERTNYGTWLALWDRWGGSWVRSSAGPPTAYGLVEANHRHTLLSAWFGPLLRGNRPLPAPPGEG
ncbi:MAG: sterol desaturase family protein [Myxococcales bacterium]|nr:sterol desaturase family protein [Myxococcales bacterium]